MDAFTNGEFKPPEDPEMAGPLPDPVDGANEETSKEKEDGDKSKPTETASEVGKREKSVDEFKDKNGLHYKGS